MKNAYKYILAETAREKIDKNTAVELITLFKQESAVTEDIAITGIAVESSDCYGTEKLWKDLCSGRNFISDFPNERKEVLSEYLSAMGIDVNEVEFKKGAYLRNIDKFDCNFFGMSPNEAKITDPNQRMFLQCAYHALEDAGRLNSSEKSKTGIYVGFASEMRDSYIKYISEVNKSNLEFAVPANLSSIIPSRISFLRDFHGPAMLIDTACSSSLTAVHLACYAIRNGDCEQALVGGARIDLMPRADSPKIGIESSDGYTRTFDDSTDGTGSGEGVAAVFLRPLSKALSDGDKIYAVIKGSALNQDGKAAGITVPNVNAQAEVLCEAWKRAGIDPSTLSYIEAHGTGTKLGDPIEVDGLQNAFKRYTDKKQFCAIGSIKSNMGHLYEAAGIMGLVKAAFIARHRVIPPTLNFKCPNERINFENSALYVCDRLRPVEKSDAPLRCGVSAFGFSGTNCHVVLEQPPERDIMPSNNGAEYHLFSLSAKTKDSLQRSVTEYVNYLARTNNSLEDICYTTNRIKEQFGCRLAIIAETKEDLYNKLRNWSFENNQDNVYSSVVVIVDDERMLQMDNAVLRSDINKLNAEFSQYINKKEVLNEEDVRIIAEYFVKGAAINWKSVYKTVKIIVDVPLYSFEDTSYWFNVTDQASTNNVRIIHPLLQRLLVESENFSIFSTTLSVSSHFVLSDHIIMGEHIIPGTTYVELARMVGEYYFGYSPIKLTDMLFMKPIMVNGDDYKEIQIVVKHGDNILDVSIKSKNKDETWDMHAQCVIERATQSDDRECFDIYSFIADKEIKTDKIDQQKLTKGFIEFGPRWINYKELDHKGNEYLARIELDPQFIMDLDVYKIHPSIMDMAVNAVSLVKGERYLPFYYGSIEIFDNMPERVFSYVVPKGDVNHNEIIVYDVNLMDENGNVFMKINDYQLKKVHEFKSLIKNSNFYSHIVWKPDVATGESLSLDGQDYLMIHNDVKTASRLSEELSKRGASAKSCLLSDIVDGKNDVVWKKNVLLLLSEEENIIEDCSELLSLLFDLIKNNYMQNHVEDCKFSFVSVSGKSGLSDDEIRISPTNNAVRSFLSVAFKEDRQTLFRAIDIDTSAQIEFVVSQMEKQIREELTAVRDGKAYVSIIQKYNIEELPMNENIISNGKTYIITGGMGGLGLSVAKIIGSLTAVNIILTGRKELNDIIGSSLENKLKLLQDDISKFGSTVEYHRCDVTQRNEVHNLIETVRSKYGRINGIINAAGNAGRGFLRNKTEKDFDNVIRPKTSGILNMHLETLNEPLEFFVMFSSIASLLNLPGQSDYSAANAYMDSFALYRKSMGLPAITINWPSWLDVGMAVDNNFNIEMPVKAINSAEGLEMFHEILSRSISRIIVGNWQYNEEMLMVSGVKLSEEIMKKIQGDNGKKNNQTIGRKVDVSGKANGDYSKYERDIATIWGEVLGFDSINVYDNFYTLGGDSIIAVRIINAINRKFGISLKVSELFNYLTVYDLADHIEGKLKLSTEVSVFDYEISKIETRAYYPTTYEQRGIYYASLQSDNKILYNIPSLFHLKGAFSVEKVEAAVCEVYRRHDSLRIAYGVENNEIIQRFGDPSDFKVEHIKCELDQLNEKVNLLIKPFDLHKGPLFRAAIINASGENYLFMDVHHSAMDGFSFAIILREFVELYGGAELDVERIDYPDFAVWQNVNRENNDYNNDFVYWYENLKEMPNPLCIYGDVNEENTNVNEGGIVEFYIDEQMYSDIKKLASDNSSTVYSIFLAAYYILLWRYSGQEDIIIGSPVAGRESEELENVIGMFVNTLPIRIKADEQWSVEELLSAVHHESIGAISHQKFDFERILSTMRADGTWKTDSIYDVMFTLQNISKNVEITDIGIPDITIPFNEGEMTSCSIDKNSAHQQLSLEIVLREASAKCYFEYSSLIFTKSAASLLIKRYLIILRQFIEKRDCKLSNLQMIDEEDRYRLMETFNSNKLEYDKKDLVYLKIERNAVIYSDKTAVRDKSGTISYAELNAKANQIARYFSSLGIGENDLVALLLLRCTLMVEIILALWKLGAAYVPLDVSYPSDRINNVISDSKAKLAVYDETLVDSEIVSGCKSLSREELENNSADLADNNIDMSVDAERLAYVIYTSGSTGKPKGAMIQQKGMLNHMNAKVADTELDNNTIIVENASQCFDISVWQFFAALTTGGTVLIYPDDVVMNVESFVQSVIDDKVTVLEVVPSFLNVILGYMEDKKFEFPCLKYLYVTGEQLNASLVERWFSIYSNVKMVNAYGPTEASDDITHYIMSSAPGTQRISIGSPIANMNIYILDNYRNLCPEGIRGEVYVSGIGVGKGYLNNPEKTKAAFSVDPFREGNIPMYATGDIGEWLEDGTISLWGRKDYQVKIRGFRIELGEIENTLTSCPGVTMAAVVDKQVDNGEKYLCAYYVAPEDPGIESIKDYLKQSLASYMIPSAFLCMDSFPLTSNGKIDRKKLPDVSFETKEYVAPVTEEEKVIAEVFEKVLNIKPIGMTNSFYEFGGDSIAAIRVISLIKEQGYETDIRDLLHVNTVGEFAANLTKSESSEKYPQDEISGDFRLLPVQKNFINSAVFNPNYYNQGIMLDIDGDISHDVMEKVLEQLSKHHDMLRMIITDDGGRILPYDQMKGFELYDVTIDADSDISVNSIIYEKNMSVNRSIDIRKGPMFKVVCYHHKNSTRLYICAHHLIVDGVSWMPLIEDMLSLIEAYRNGMEAVLPGKTASFIQWSEHLWNIFESARLDNQKKYWNDILVRIPDGKINVSEADEEANGIVKCSVSLDGSYSIDAINNAAANYLVGAEEILITALAKAICNKYGQSSVAMNIESHGRDDAFGSVLVYRTIGWFTSVYPIVVKISDDVESSVISVKEELHSVPDGGIGYGMLSNGGALDNTDSSVDVTFNYFGNMLKLMGRSVTVDEKLIGPLSDDNNQPETPLVVDVSVVDNYAVIYFSGKKTMFDSSSLESLAVQMVNDVKDIIDYCLNKNEVVRTASDVGAQDMSDDELESLNDFLDELDF